MTNILVHVHVFYPEMWPELKECLNNIDPNPYDLYVTLVKEDPALQYDIQAFHPDAKILVVENLGYDVGPFMHVLNQVNLDSYDYLIKLHTKRDLPHGSRLDCYNVAGGLWRKYALAFVQDKKSFNLCLQAFERNPKLGMCSFYRLLSEYERGDWTAVEACKKFLKQMNLPEQNFGFVAGTMFMARAALFKPVQKLGIVLTDFEKPDRAVKTSLAHSLERLFGWVIGAQGYTIEDCFSCPRAQFWQRLSIPLRSIGHFLYRTKDTSKGKRMIKICKIPFYIKVK